MTQSTAPLRKSFPYLLGIALLVGFAAFAYTEFADALTPYVDYEKAMDTERQVQVAGGLESGSSRYDSSAGTLRFTLVDTEDDSKTMPVRYEGVKPANFEDAISIVAIGRFDTATSEFAAHDLLVKCPSKYQGIEEYETKSYSVDDPAETLAPEMQAPSTGPTEVGPVAGSA